MHSQIVNFGPDAVSLTISTTRIEGSVNALGSTATVLTSGNVMDENSFTNPNKVLHHLFYELHSNMQYLEHSIAIRMSYCFVRSSEANAYLLL